MKTHASPVRSFQFYFPEVDTLLLVEEREDEVIVRSTRNTFSERRKFNFIRELAAEGFISDQYQYGWFREFTACGTAIRWVVDVSWLKLSRGQVLRTRRFMIRLLSAGALVWLALMAALFLFLTPR